MAVAKKFTRKLKHVVVKYTEQTDCVELNLLPEEAQFLLKVMYCIGGNPTDSPRHLADSIRRSLDEAGVEQNNNHCVEAANKSIYFLPY